MSWSYCLGMDAPNSLAKASDRRVRADNGSVGHGSSWLSGSTNRDGSHGPVTHGPMINMHPETDEAISIVLEGLKIS